ncbi:MAG: class I SAM-dependent DNA methyltransferase, partial [Tepidisphaeraceae bacterium]
RVRRELQNACQGLARVLVIAQTANALAFTFKEMPMVFSHKCVVFPLDSFASFAALQNRSHHDWSRFFGSTMKDDSVYTPSDCFDTFPFPEHFETLPTLEKAGQKYYDFRAQLMVNHNEGLTRIYNRFHDPNETSPDIFRLRELHAAMDRAVLDAYGWTDLKPTCEFLLDYEDEEEDEEAANSSARSRKKPWRYRWPDEFRDEVLARLLALNAKRAEEERLAGAALDKPKKLPAKRKKPDEGPSMF